VFSLKLQIKIVFFKSIQIFNIQDGFFIVTSVHACFFFLNCSKSVFSKVTICRYNILFTNNACSFKC